MQVSLRDRLRGAVLAAMRAGKRENDVKRQGWLQCGLASGISRIEPVLFSQRVSLRAEPENQSEVTKMSHDFRRRG